MKEYFSFDFGKYIGMMHRRGWPPEEILLTRIFMEDVYTRRGLQRLGMRDSEIDEMADGGSLKRVKVDHGTAISLGMKDRMADDPLYMNEILRRLENARNKMENDPDWPNKAREYLISASKARQKERRKRTLRLLNMVILPNYGVRDESGELEKPESVCMSELVELMKNDTPYRDIAEQIYRMDGHRNFYMEVYRDVVALGIRPKTKKEIADRTSNMIKEKAMNDLTYYNTLLRCIREATRARMKLYEDDPELKEAHIKAMVDARMKKLQDDPEFREQMLSNLALGNPAYWDKMRSDQKFRERQLKKHRRTLDKGRSTIMKRAERRRSALYRQVIEPEFGGLGCRIGQKRIETLLNEKYTRVSDRYYSDTPNPRNLLKKDLYRLRQDLAGASV